MSKGGVGNEITLSAVMEGGGSGNKVGINKSGLFSPELNIEFLNNTSL